MKKTEKNGVAQLQKIKSKAGVFCTILKITRYMECEHIICANHKEARQKAKELNIVII